MRGPRALRTVRYTEASYERCCAICLAVGRRRPAACATNRVRLRQLEEQASLPTRAGLAGGRVIHLLEHSWYAQQICRFEGTQIGQQRLCVRQITNHAVVGSNRRVLDEPCETVGERQEEKQSRMIFENDLMQRQTACARDRYEIAVRKLGTLGAPSNRTCTRWWPDRLHAPNRCALPAPRRTR